MVISRLEKEAEVTKTQNDKAADARIKLAVLPSSYPLLATKDLLKSLSKLKPNVTYIVHTVCVCVCVCV